MGSEMCIRDRYLFSSCNNQLFLSSSISSKSNQLFLSSSMSSKSRPDILSEIAAYRRNPNPTNSASNANRRMIGIGARTRNLMEWNSQ